MVVNSSLRAVCVAVFLPVMYDGDFTDAIKYIPSYIGPYLGYVERFEDCVGSADSKVDFRLTHYNPNRPFEKQRWWGNFTYGVPIDDHKSEVSLRLDRWANNQWKENFYIIRFSKNACSTTWENLKMLNPVMRAINATRGRGVCFVPAGSAQLQNQTLDFTFPNAPVLAYGRYRARAITTHQDYPNQKNCLQLIYDMIQKPY